ncbi:META domain-containing protein [Paracoccus methylovorus]|uniref:META domain-containing protein n=1 Tax=Paracoccus methylovorus TaxID=2812658 RepID=A0ABX7JQU6_9RHOB|nr:MULTISPECIES: META domain-containing protein [Paracoccus]QRZ15369.1 META domain-containing protein [Paracoccus methylovorus]
MTRIPMISAAIAATLALAACEPTSGNTPGSNVPTGPYVLVGIGSDTVPQRNVGMTIEADGSVSGQGPCNHYSAKQTAEPPAFALGPLTTSRMACAGNAGRLETRFFEALSAANGITYEGGVLTIQGPTYLTFEPGYRK